MPKRKTPSHTDVPEETAPCVDKPEPFFAPLSQWSATFAQWATEVEGCYEGPCGSAARRAALLKLCKEFSKFAQHAKTWADDVEDCFQEKCQGPPGHTKPPPPPF